MNLIDAVRQLEGNYKAEKQQIAAEQEAERQADLFYPGDSPIYERIPPTDAIKQPELGPGQIADVKLALRFMLAGNAYFTLRSKKSGTRFTYHVSRCKDEHRNELYFVSVLTGPENTHDYRYIGVISFGQFRRTQRSKLTESAPSVQAFVWTLERFNADRFPDNLEMWHEGRCGRCGRKLTVPESIAAGIGPECAGRL